MNYKHSQATINYAKEILEIIEECPDVTSTSFHKLCGLIMENDKQLMSEAMGIDNPYWEKNVVPIFMDYLKNQPSQYNSGYVMQEAICDYLQPMIQELFNRLTDEDN